MLSTLRSSAAQLGQICAQEASVNIVGRRAKLVAAFLVLGGMAPNLLLMWFRDRNAGAGLHAAEQARLMLRLYDDAVAQSLAGCPPEVVSFTIFVLLFVPVIVLLLGFDVLSRDRERGTDRYLCQRVGRTTLIVGKFFGLWLTAGAILAVLHVLLWIAVAATRPDALHSLWPWLPRLWLACALFVAPYAGIATLVSSLFQSSSVVPAAGLAALCVLWVAKLIAHLWPSASWIDGWLPGVNDAGLLAMDNAARFGAATGVLFVWAAVCVAASATRYRLQDLP